MKPSLFALLFVWIAFSSCKQSTSEEKNQSEDPTAKAETSSVNFNLNPISHATAVFKIDSTVFYMDPVGGKAAFEKQPQPDVILVTDIHGDHFNLETLKSVAKPETKIIVPQAVADLIEDDISKQLLILANEEQIELSGIKIEGIAMYNMGNQEEVRHTKGRGNGYVLEKDGFRIYFSGDTEDVPEMRALNDIDKAFVCMNLPYTMSVEAAAAGVLAFEPKEVYPYHYRGQDGLADVEKFKKLVNDKNKNIKVNLVDWYPVSN